MRETIWGAALLMTACEHPKAAPPSTADQPAAHADAAPAMNAENRAELDRLEDAQMPSLDHLDDLPRSNVKLTPVAPETRAAMVLRAHADALGACLRGAAAGKIMLHLDIDGAGKASVRSDADAKVEACLEHAIAGMTFAGAETLDYPLIVAGR